jgi:hypothetical protein
MPWPAALNLVTIGGTVEGPAGALAAGQVEFYPPYVLRDASDNVLLGTKPIIGTLVGGALSMQVPANDSPNVQPQGWAYHVVVRTDQLFYEFDAVVPSSPSINYLNRIAVVVDPTPPATFVPLTDKGQPNGVVPLDGTNHIPSQYLPAGSGVLTVTAGDSTIVIGGTPANPTVRVGAIAESQVTNLATDLAAKYVKPGGGIPSTDMSAAVQTSLGLANTALQSVPASVTSALGTPFPPAGYGYHSAACPLETATQQSTISEQWFSRVWVPAGNAITKVGVFLRTAGTFSSTGLNGFAIYSDAGGLLWSSTSDDTMWTVAGEVSKAVTPNIAAQAAGTWYRVALSVHGYSPPPNFPFANFAGVSVLSDAGNYRSRYKQVAYSAWPSSFSPGVDLQGTAGFMVPMFLG